MKQIKTIFENDIAKKEYVNSCEAEFEAQLEAAGASIASGGIKIIMLTGPTCSGKTTTANKLISEFEKNGRKIHIISLDDFYFDRDYLLSRTAPGGEIDYDSPDTIDADEFERVAAEITTGGFVRVPHFDFVRGTRTAYEEIMCTDADAFVFEGIQALYPNVRRHLHSHDTTSIFISVATDALTEGGLEFDRRDIRFFRRLVRDCKFRGASPQFTANIWRGVCANEDANITPFMDECDIKIDSMLGYELSAIKPYLLSALSEIMPDDEFFAEAEKIIKKFDGIDEIAEKFIPEKSVFREFIG